MELIRSLGSFSLQECKTIQYLDRNVFGNLTFQTIDLSNMDIEVLGTEFFENTWTSLQTLEIAISGLSEFPTDILSGMTNLIKLDVDGNELTTVPKLTCRSPLQKLYIGFNQITQIETGAFDLCTDLEYISLFKNQFTKLPTGKSN